jgi:hypothetical protein
MTATAYLNHGRWVAECPADWCGDAKGLYPQLPTTDGSTVLSPNPVYLQRCVNGHEFRIEAPPDDMRAQIEAALADRPEQFRDWLPNGHPWSANGHPTNQSPADLAAENEELKARLAAVKSTKQDEIRAALAAAGIEVRPDGSFSGSI